MKFEIAKPLIGLHLSYSLYFFKYIF